MQEPLRLTSVLDSLAGKLESLTPEIRKAAVYVLENPNEIGVSSIRAVADQAGVKPNTLVRLSRIFGFEGYDDFRAPFRNDIRQGGNDFPDRARWLQSLSGADRQSELYAQMAAATLSNIEKTFSEINPATVKQAADAICAAERTFALGVGVGHMLARNFAYLAGMAIDGVRAIPNDANPPIDDIARAGKNDVLLALTFKPYRIEVVSAVRKAREKGMTIIGISDSPASPIIGASDFGFVVQSRTPQFFTSTVATAALLETLVAFVIADASPDVIEKIERFHAQRHAIGLYVDERSR